MELIVQIGKAFERKRIAIPVRLSRGAVRSDDRPFG